MWSCCAGVPSSDALQELRRKEQKRKVEEEKQEISRKSKVRPAFGDGLAVQARLVLMLCRKHAGRSRSRSARRSSRS